MGFRPGQVIRFTYLSSDVEDQSKEVLVLHPGWRTPRKIGGNVQTKPYNIYRKSRPLFNVDRETGERTVASEVNLHGIDLKRLTRAQRAVLLAVFDPNTPKTGNAQRLPGENVGRLIDDILARMNPLDEVTNPVAFYSKFVKPFLNDPKTDAYRKYKVHLIARPTVVKQSAVRGEIMNPNPLFRTVRVPTRDDIRARIAAKYQSQYEKEKAERERRDREEREFQRQIASLPARERERAILKRSIAQKAYSKPGPKPGSRRVDPAYSHPKRPVGRPRTKAKWTTYMYPKPARGFHLKNLNRRKPKKAKPAQPSQPPKQPIGGKMDRESLKQKNLNLFLRNRGMKKKDDE